MIPPICLCWPCQLPSDREAVPLTDRTGCGTPLGATQRCTEEKIHPGTARGDTPINDKFHLLLAQGVKQGGLAIRNPVAAASRLHQASTEATSLLVATLLDNTALDNEAHAGCVQTTRTAARKELVAEGKTVVEHLSRQGGPKVTRHLEWMRETVAWLTVISDHFGWTVLSLQEWHDNLSLRYGKIPKGLPRNCDGCGAGFTVKHGLNCKKGGLVTIRHNDVRDEWAHLCGLALTSSRVTTERLINYGDYLRATQGQSTRRGNATTLGEEARGEVGAHGFWQWGRSTIFDICITDITHTHITGTFALKRAFHQYVP